MNKVWMLPLIGVVVAAPALANNNIGTRSVYFCNQLVDGSVQRTTENPDGSQSYTIQSHVITVFADGGRLTEISLDGANDLTLAKSPNDLLGKPVAGYTGYTMDTDSGEADEWGANVFFQDQLMGAGSTGNGRMIVRNGQEEGDSTDTSFYCNFNEGGVWPRR